MDDKVREAIGLKKFSIIAPVLNGQVTSNIEYFNQIAAAPIEMPYLGMRQYKVKTLQGWLQDYRRQGLDGLIKGKRSDKGKRRKITPELEQTIIEARKKRPSMPISVFYEHLVSEKIIDPCQISRPTIYRFIADTKLTGAFKEDTQEKELRRFSHEHVGDLCQADVLYGPKIKAGKKHIQTYLHAIIDDHSRYPMYSQFYLSQGYETLRHCLKEAVMRRGIPRLLYTDNGKIYRSQQFEFICASLGCTLLHSQPYVPNGRGKVERFFKTVRTRFLSGIDEKTLTGLNELNTRYFKWLEEDYCKKAHSGLGGLTPHDVLMSQISRLKYITNRELLDETFLYRVNRKIGHDATFQIENTLYETDPRLSGQRLEIRYEPVWLGDDTKELPIYSDGKKIELARMVRFHDNAHAKRKSGNPKKNLEEPIQGQLFLADLLEKEGHRHNV